MSSLSQLLAAHRTILVLDAASLHVQVGLIRAGVPALWRGAHEEAGTSVFGLVASLLDEASFSLGEIEAFIFCAGPGSMLGIRTTAMALRTWQALHARPVYAYSSLALAAHGARQSNRNSPAEFAMIADARRDSWHYLPVSAQGALGRLQRVATAELPAKQLLLTPEHFRAWSQSPPSLATTSYDLAAIFATLAHEDYFQATTAPDVFQLAAPDYKKWSAQIHQAAPILS